MKKQKIAAVSAVLLSGLMSSAWAISGGSWDGSTLTLNSKAGEKVNVEITSGEASDINNSGDFTIKVVRSSPLAQNSTIVLPAEFKVRSDWTKSSCISLYELTGYDIDGSNVTATAQKAAVDGFANANQPYLMITNVDDGNCTDITEIEFDAKNIEATASGGVVSQKLANNANPSEKYLTFYGTYKYEIWGSVPGMYSYAAKTEKDVVAGNFVQIREKDYTPPLRSYMEYTGSESFLAKSAADAKVKFPETIDVRIIDGENTAGIVRMNTRTGVMMKVDSWYDLKGRKLISKPENKGMFIGKKVIQK